MPTTECRARKLIKSGKAVKACYRSMFTIRLIERKDGDTQSIEFKMDTGYQHVGVSICSQKHEYVNAQYDLLKDEAERHNDRRKYRSARRNRKTRYRKPRWNNRKSKIAEEGFAPSIRNKRDVQIRLFEQYNKILPLTTATFEVGQFDTQLLKAIEEGKPIPQSKDYQYGEKYGYASQREAVFSRDNRILSKFYDAKYMDIRDGKVKSGKDLSCGRTNRSESRHSDKNECIYRGHKVKKGYRSIRKQHYQYRPGDTVYVDGMKYTVKGIISNGTRIALNERLSISVNKVNKTIHTGGWKITA